MFSNALNHIVTIIQHNPHWGIIAAFVVAFVESIAIIGSIIPGSLTMTAIGSLVGTRLLPFLPTFSIAVLGAFLGDILSFWIGLRFKSDFKRKKWLKKYQHWIDQGIETMKVHGIKSIVIGRFLGPMRSIMPLVAGLLEMPSSRFMIAAFISAFFWALLYLIPGILLGAYSFEFPPERITKIISLIFSGIIVCLLFYFFWRSSQLWRQHIEARILKKESIWFSHHPTVKKILFGNVSDSIQCEQMISLSKCMLAFPSLCILTYLTFHGNSFLHSLNFAIYSLLQSTHTHAFTTFIAIISGLGSWQYLLIATFTIFFLQLADRQQHTALYSLVLFLATCIITHVLKEHIHILRPPLGLQLKTSFSFPSSHTSLFICSFGFWLHRFSEEGILSNGKRLAYLSTTVIMFSRIYLGMHWLTDVLAGFLLGHILLSIMMMVYRRLELQLPQKNKLSITHLWQYAILCFSLLFVWSIQHYYRYEKFTLHYPKYTLTLQQWQQQHNPIIPHYRSNRFGKIKSPFNLQIVGSGNALTTYLSAQKWTRKENTPNWLKRLTSIFDPSQQYLFPLFNPLYQDKPPKFIYSKVIGHDLWITHIWFSNIWIDHTHELWLGTLVRHPMQRFLQASNQKTLHASPFNLLQQKWPQSHTLLLDRSSLPFWDRKIVAINLISRTQ
jgi:membrane protein DedA with SNARE-associated domain/membrane-associated phospholipid phosphatase